MATSLERKTSRYVQGGTTELTQNRLGFWDRQIFPKDSTDVVVTLDTKYHKRPWLLAYDVYKDVSLTWFILQYNTVLDIETEFVAGVTITYPTPFRLKIGILNRSS